MHKWEKGIKNQGEEKLPIDLLERDGRAGLKNALLLRKKLA